MNQPIAKSYKRLYKGPIDSDSKFDNMELAVEYAKSPTAYSGQIISIKTENSWKLYTIQEDKSLSIISGNGIEWEIIS